MKLTATREEIEAYQRKVEKNEIAPHSLPPCPVCQVCSEYFKGHAYRERQFLIIENTFTEKVFCSLVRFACTGCNKTFTFYPDFAIPNKHYTLPTIMRFSANYVENDDISYEKATMIDHQTPGYPDTDSTSLAGSTIYRWISTLGQFARTSRNALSLIMQENPSSNICRSLAQIVIPRRKYRSESRKKLLLNCRQLIMIEKLFQDIFKKVSIFTNLATRYQFS